MSISFTGRLSRSAGEIAAIAKQIKIMSLQPVSKLTVRFDPFAENVKMTRNLLHYISAPRVTKTNLSCILTTDIVCDRSEPTITCDLTNGEKVLFKCANLNAVDILKLYNKHISALAPVAEVEETGIIKKLKKQKIKIRISRHRR
ncbi:39S ribosomal protein L53, mitochondrial [Aphidius gifuensis]|uniref:39S ribosomal protein L53, mitochondrial n=1 Tax=Aphidius gifuensis TaxID=684658 RepID=UPI001CDC0981|nr:39S ribosomal protein L53, mitochondrial [Aphidius gifuensis]